MDRPKRGFSIPIAKWLKKGELFEWASALLAPDKLRREGLLQVQTVEQIWRDFTERNIFRVQIWYLLMLEEWLGKEAVGC